MSGGLPVAVEHAKRPWKLPYSLSVVAAFYLANGEKKRRGWDSNPRDGFTPPTRFPVALLRPTRTPLRTTQKFIRRWKTPVSARVGGYTYDYHHDYQDADDQVKLVIGNEYEKRMKWAAEECARNGIRVECIYITHAGWDVDGHLRLQVPYREMQYNQYQECYFSYSHEDHIRENCARPLGQWMARTGVTQIYIHQYDQAGLMIRVSKDFWLKTSVEYEDDTLSRLGVVVTNFGYSDWSTQDFNPQNNEIDLRVSKTGMDCLVEFRLGDAPWSQMRMAHLHRKDDAVQCGIYACSPIDTGYIAEFDFLEIAINS